eukprot:747003-Hanusia_phi.AAC.3
MAVKAGSHDLRTWVVVSSPPGAAPGASYVCKAQRSSSERNVASDVSGSVQAALLDDAGELKERISKRSQVGSSQGGSRRGEKQQQKVWLAS